MSKNKYVLDISIYCRTIYICHAIYIYVMQKKMKDSGDEDRSEDDKSEKTNKKMEGKAKRK